MMRVKRVTVWLLVVLAAHSLIQVTAQRCANSCRIPACRCPTTNIPGGVPISDTPQMVLITFTGAIDGSFIKLHSKLFPVSPPKERQNPNRCPMVSTVFVREKRTDFCAVNRLWAYGHEIGMNGRALRNEGFWTDSGIEAFTKEFDTARTNLVEKAKIPEDEIYGVRSPTYKTNDDYYLVIDELELEYDSTMALASKEQGASTLPPTFPFTMDHLIDYRSPTVTCLSGNCPTQRYPHLWQVPVFELRNETTVCKDLVLCPNITRDGVNGVLKFLLKNFDYHYEGNRVPFVINLDIPRLKLDQDEILIQGLSIFLDYLSNLDDAWVVSMHQAVSWMKTPRSVSEADSLAAWGCQTHLMDACQVDGISNDDLTSGGSNSTDSEDDEDDERKSIKGLFPDGETLVFWQTIFLVILFFIIYQYDRITNKK